MMEKQIEQRQRWGSTLAESIGERPGESLLPAEVEGTRPTMFMLDRRSGSIALAEVIPDPDQPRKEFDEDALEQLAESLKSRGQLQPIRVRWHAERAKWIIISGERRYRACKLAGFEKIECKFVDGDVDETDLRTDQLVENLLREELRPVEEAHSYQELMRLNDWNGKQLAEHLKVSVAKVSRSLSLLKLTPELQEQVDAGDVPATAGHEIAKAKTPEQREALVNELRKQGSAKTSNARKLRLPKNQKRRTTKLSYRTSNGARVEIGFNKKADTNTVLAALRDVIITIESEAEEQPLAKAS